MKILYKIICIFALLFCLVPYIDVFASGETYNEYGGGCVLVNTFNSGGYLKHVSFNAVGNDEIRFTLIRSTSGSVGLGIASPSQFSYNVKVNNNSSSCAVASSVTTSVNGIFCTLYMLWPTASNNTYYFGIVNSSNSSVTSSFMVVILINVCSVSTPALVAVLIKIHSLL